MTGSMTVQKGVEMATRAVATDSSAIKKEIATLYFLGMLLRVAVCQSSVALRCEPEGGKEVTRPSIRSVYNRKRVAAFQLGFLF